MFSRGWSRDGSGCRAGESLESRIRGLMRRERFESVERFRRWVKGSLGDARLSGKRTSAILIGGPHRFVEWESELALDLRQTAFDP
jgi:hypothetical protein